MASAELVAPTAQLAEGSARMQKVAGYNRQPRTHAPALLNYLITSQQLAVRRTRNKSKSPSQASGGTSTLQSRASGLQSTTQGNSIRTKRLLRVKNIHGTGRASGSPPNRARCSRRVERWQEPPNKTNLQRHNKQI